MKADLERAANALRDGELVVYPTETVYGLGADARSETAVERVFAAKRRDPTDPVSFAVSTLADAETYVRFTPLEQRFAATFLPGPVTLVLERRERAASEEGDEPVGLASALGAGRDRVGLRVPDHDDARALLETVSPMPVTATSANVSGRPSARVVEDLDPEVRSASAVVIDGGSTPGGGSTVVDVGTGTIHRRGPLGESVARWLEREHEA